MKEVLGPNVARALARLGVEPRRIAALCARWGVAEFSFFGSVLRDDFRPDSDADVLVTLAPDFPRADWYGVDMVEQLEGMFGRKVDLAYADALANPFLRDAILKTRETVFGL